MGRVEVSQEEIRNMARCLPWLNLYHFRSGKTPVWVLAAPWGCSLWCVLKHIHSSESSHLYLNNRILWTLPQGLPFQRGWAAPFLEEETCWPKPSSLDTFLRFAQCPWNIPHE